MSDDLKSILKTRSGKNSKCLVTKLQPKNENNCLFFAAFLACQKGEFSISLHEKDIEALNIKEKGTYFVKNLDFCEEIENIPVFKLSDIASIKESKAGLKEQELSQLKEIDYSKFLEVEFSQFLGNTSRNVAQRPHVNLLYQKEVVTLMEFLSLNSSKIQGKQRVEVIV